MGGNKRRRKKSKVKDEQPPSKGDSDGTKNINDGVVAQLEFKVKGGPGKHHNKNEQEDVPIPASWSVEYVQEIQKKSPPPISIPRGEEDVVNVLSVKDVGLQMVRGTLERIASRTTKKRSKTNTKSKLVVKPTPIQLRLWPVLLDSFDKKGESNTDNGLNVVGIAPTGTGKTMAYCIPIIAQCVRTLLYQSILLSSSSSKKQETKQQQLSTNNTNVHALVLVPTRELAIQVSKEFKVAAKVANKYLSKCSKKEKEDDDDANDAIVTMKVESMAIYGGVDIDTQINTLLGKEDGKEEEATTTKVVVGHKSLVVAATAGRLLDILKRSSSSESNKKEEEEEEEGESKTVSLLLASSVANLQAIVFDEADRIAVNADMAGQVDEILDILKRARENNNDNTTATGGGDVVTCLVSATLPEKAKEMCEKWVPRDRLVVKVDSVKVGQKQVGDVTIDDDDAPTDNKEISEKDGESSAKEVVENDDGKKKKNKHLLHNLDLASIPSNIVQTLHVCSNHKKPKKLILTLQRIYLNKSATQQGGRFSVNNRLCIVFFAQIKTVKYMSNLLVKEGLRCVELYGSLHQTEREKRLLDFKAGKRPILLATDVAARGLHIPNVHFVVNYDFPGSLDQYVHRCGRAGRKQALSGEDSKEYPPTVYSFYNRELRAMASSVVELLKACNAWVDPNLLELVKDKKESSTDNSNKSKRKRKRKASSAKSETERNKTGNDDDESQSDNDDQFAFLGGSALKRASHVSDAEDSDGDDDSS